MRNIKVAIADDSPTIRQTLHSFLEANTDWQVCGEAEDGAAAISLTQRLNPDLLILDLSMPVMNGLEAARRISSICPKTGIVLFTMYATDQLLIEAKRVGIKAVLPKGGKASLERLVEVLQEVADTVRAPDHPSNVIEHMRAESEERYRALFDLAPVAVYSCDAGGVIREYNSRAAELWGRRPQVGDTDERFCGSFRLYRPDGSYMAHEQCPMGDVLTGKVLGTHDAEVHIERPDGSRIIVIVNIAPLKNEQGQIIGAINCFYDVTERKKADEALRQSVADRLQAEKALRENETRLRLANEELECVVQKRTASLRHLSAKLMRSQDEERRRIARNLHDSLGQYLASIKMNLELLGGSDAPNKDEILLATLESVERSLSETRTLSCLLHPPLLDEVGFTSAARWYTDEFAKRSGIKVELELPEGVDRGLPELVRIALFRILQESLTNVHRHSGSPSVEVHLKVSDDQAALTVRDFGRGVPAELTQGSQTNGDHFGVGLSGMRERVNDLGGTFEIQSSGNGTLIILSIPVATQTSETGTTVRKKPAA